MIFSRWMRFLLVIRVQNVEAKRWASVQSGNSQVRPSSSQLQSGDERKQEVPGSLLWSRTDKQMQERVKVPPMQLTNLTLETPGALPGRTSFLERSSQLLSSVQRLSMSLQGRLGGDFDIAIFGLIGLSVLVCAVAFRDFLGMRCGPEGMVYFTTARGGLDRSAPSLRRLL